MSQELYKELQDWAEETADLYHNLATTESDCNLAFYTQSDLTKIERNPDLMILGINPGVDPRWGVPKYDPDDRVTGTRLMKGNGTFNKDVTWRFWRNMKEIFNRGGIGDILTDESKFVYTNVILFNTKKAADIPQRAFELISQTLDLIKIVRPQRILCLGKDDCFARLKQYIERRETIEPKDLIPNELSVFKYNDIPIYGIPHTSKAISYAEMDMLGSCLAYLFEHGSDNISHEQFCELFAHDVRAWRESKVPVDFKVLTDSIEGLLGKPYKNCGKTWRYRLCGKLALTVTETEGGHIAIRAAKEYAQEGDWNGALNERQQCSEILTQHGFRPYAVWLGKKYIRGYDSLDGAIEELKEIKEQLQAVSE